MLAAAMGYCAFLRPRGRPTDLTVACRVYILRNEGYDGFGFDLRARKSWALFSPLGADLRESAFVPSALLDDDDERTKLFRPSSFIIGNHADELTPWIPIIASLVPDCASANIPCCSHQLVGRYNSIKHIVPCIDVIDAFGLKGSSEQKLKEAEGVLAASGLETVIGRTALGGRYQAYVRYVAHLTLSSGCVTSMSASFSA